MDFSSNGQSTSPALAVLPGSMNICEAEKSGTDPNGDCKLDRIKDCTEEVKDICEDSDGIGSGRLDRRLSRRPSDAYSDARRSIVSSERRESVVRKEFLMSTIKAMRATNHWAAEFNVQTSYASEEAEQFINLSNVVGEELFDVVDINIHEQNNGKRASKCLLDHNGNFVRRWDSVTMMGLSYTAVVTPVEVSFIDQEVRGLFIMNQIITLIFFVDMILQFFLPYETLGADGIQVVKERYRIATHYLKGWFILDFVSIIPLDTVGGVTDSMALKKLQVMRFVRLLRLLKMFRLFRASRILTRWQTRLAVPYSLQTMMKFFMMLIFGAHWIGCCWGLIGLSVEEYSWVDFLQESKPRGMEVVGNPFHLYLASLHFAIMTITSIGYGDISPQQSVEYIFVVILQCLGGMLWAYSMGEVMGVISNMNPAGTLFKQTMDQLNIMMRDHQLPRDMQRNLRSFFLQAKELHQAERYGELLQQMSPKLQGEVARVTNMRWISKVWYLRPKTEKVDGVSDVFIAKLAVSLKSRVYAQSEVIRSDDTLHVLTRGLAQFRKNWLRNGDVWGEDLILQCKQLRRKYLVLACTFVEVQEVTGKTMRNIADSCSVYGDDKYIRRAVVKLAFIRGFVRFCKKFKEVRKKLEDKKRSRANSIAMSDTSILSQQVSGCQVSELRMIVREEVRQVLREELRAMQRPMSPS